MTFQSKYDAHLLSNLYDDNQMHLMYNQDIFI